MIDTGELLKACRLFRRMSVTELSEASGVPRNTIWGAESRPSCNTDTFNDLLNAMGFRIEIVPDNNFEDWRIP